MVQVATARRSQRDYSDRQEPLGRPRVAPKGEKVVKKRLAKQERILNGNSSPAPVEVAAPPPQSTHQQMTLLALLSTISQDTLASPRITTTLQQIKAALFARDYAAAFAKPDYLRAYVARWVPSRALAYREMFGGGVESVSELFRPREGEARRRTRKIRKEKVVVEEDPDAEAEDAEDAEDKPEGEEEEDESEEEEEEEEDKATRDLNVICIGGGAGSEVLALCAVVREQGTPARVNVQAVDMADWGMVLGEMTDVVEDKWRLSEDRINVKFIKQDVIAGFTPKEIAAAEDKALDKGKQVDREEKPDYASANLITLLFTTAELLTASRASTLSFLSLLTRETKPGALLMIVESAGSFSALAVGKEKTFPLEFLLDFVLAGGKAGDGGGWEIVQKEESRWYRLPEAAAKNYPLRLENMRHMLRVYRRRG